MSLLAKAYESPEHPTSQPAYHVLDFARLTFGELWCSFRSRRLPARCFLQVMLAKLLHRSMRSGPPVLANGVAVVDLDSVPEIIRQHVRPELEYLESAGFEFMFAIHEELTKAVRGWSVLQVSIDRLIWSEIKISERDISKSRGPERIVRFNTLREDGRVLCTENIDSSAWKHVELEVRIGLGISQLLDIHRHRVRDCHNVKTVTKSDIRSWVRSCLESEADEQIRHAFVPATDNEIQRFRDRIAAPSDTILK